jgi:ubiquitin-protein ligase E3 D
MTLNDLLSAPTKWNPIVPDRRHSLPPSRQPPPSAVESDSSSALQTLVSNLRNRDPTDNMIEFHEPSTDSELFHELRTRVETISLSLEPADAILANALVSLLSHFNRLSVIQVSSSQPATQSRPSSSRETRDSPGSANPFHVLKCQLGDLQVERLSSQRMLPAGAPPMLAVEAALLWNRIDEELESVVAMCKERMENRSSLDILPPQYDPADYQYETPPDYESGDRTSMDDTKSRSASCSPIATSRHLDEKMRLDLEGVAMAIDRLYMVAPQLHNQRVELKSSKLAQMERASREGMSSRPGKEKEPDLHELENIFELLGKASERSLSDQKVVLEGGLTRRLEKARLRDMAKVRYHLTYDFFL